MPSNLSPREALDRIAALCDKAPRPLGSSLLGASVAVADVRAILAEVSPEPGGVLDRDRARLHLYGWQGTSAEAVERLLDALAALVRPAAIDHDALTALIHRIQEETDGDADLGDWTPQYVAEFLALVRPVAGVTLAPEEAALLLDGEHVWPHDAAPVLERLRVARLEASS